MQEGGGDLRRQEGEGTWWGLRERRRRKEQTLQKRLARSAKADGEEERRLLQEFTAAVVQVPPGAQVAALKSLLPVLHPPGQSGAAQAAVAVWYEEQEGVVQGQQREEAQQLARRWEAEGEQELQRLKATMKRDQATWLEGLRQRQASGLLQGDERSALLQAPSAELERGLEAQQQEHSEALRGKIQRQQRRKAARLQQSHNDRLARLQAVKGRAEQELALKAQLGAVGEVGAQRNEESVAMWVLTRHQQELQRLDQQFREEADRRMRLLQEDLTMQLEAAKELIQDRAMDYGNRIYRRLDLSSTEKKESMADVRGWIKNQLKHLKAVYAKEEQRSAGALITHLEIEDAERRSVLTVRYLDDLAALLEAPAGAAGALPFAAESSAFRDGIRAEQERLRGGMGRPKAAV